jgi:hypothetical protein
MKSNVLRTNAIVFGIEVVRDAFERLGKAVRQHVAVEQHQRRVRLGPRHRVEYRAHQPPVGVLTVRTERSQLGALQDRFPLRRFSRREFGHQRGICHGVEVNVGRDQ